MIPCRTNATYTPKLCGIGAHANISLCPLIKTDVDSFKIVLIPANESINRVKLGSVTLITQ
jgi:hypothetical protein